MRSTLLLVPLLATTLVACASTTPSNGASASASGATTPATTATATTKPAPSAATTTDVPPASSAKPVGDHAKDPVLSEAKNDLGAIARASQGAYMRERMPTEGTELSQALCTSAKPTPAALPSGGEKVPVTAADFATGDDNGGWKCLKFALANPVRFRYTYNAGSNYLGPKRGGVDPGPDGWEACAEADLTPGGLTTLICLTGKVDKATRTAKTNTEIFQADE